MERPLRVQLALANDVALRLADRFIVEPMERLADATQSFREWFDDLEHRTRVR